MDNVLRYASDVVVLVKGEVVKSCKPYEIFLDEENFAKLSIEEPLVIKMAKKLNSSNKYHIDLEKVKDIDTLVEQMKETEGVSDQLKEENQMEWVFRMKNIEARAREIVTTDLIYT